MSAIVEEKIQDMFSDFVLGGNSDDTIKQLYEVLPYSSHEQQRVIILYRSLAVKYNSPVLLEMADYLEKLAKSNRKLGFKFNSMLQSYSLFKHFKGYKASSNVSGGESSE